MSDLENHRDYEPEGRGIAERLVVPVNTVGAHLQHVYRNLDIPADPSGNRRVRAVLTGLQNT